MRSRRCRFGRRAHAHMVASASQFLVGAPVFVGLAGEFDARQHRWLGAPLLAELVPEPPNPTKSCFGAGSLDVIGRFQMHMVSLPRASQLYSLRIHGLHITFTFT